MREVVQFDQITGEKHVADVKTIGGLVIELQHSAMSLEELRSREAFYGHMIWIVDGRPFANQFEVLPDPLPHPESSLLLDVVFFPQLASAFWRRSEATRGLRLVEMHRTSEIAEEIRANYCGHHFFRWKRAREVWQQAKAPVFIDFGGNEVLRIGTYNPPTQWCIRRLSKSDLVEKNGGTYTPY